MSVFQFKHFAIHQNDATFKIGTDALVLGAWLELNEAPKSILDVGTGTGVLSLMLAQKFPDANIDAWDVSEAAVALANDNFRKSHLGDNCQAYFYDVLTHQSTKKYDLVVSNPPFFINAKVSSSQVNAGAKHFSAQEMQQFFLALSQLLNTNGKIALIHPVDEVFDRMAENVDLKLGQRLLVYGKPNFLKRYCSIFSSQIEAYREGELTVRDKTGAYTEAYRQLTVDYHLEGAIQIKNTN